MKKETLFKIANENVEYLTDDDKRIFDAKIAFKATLSSLRKEIDQAKAIAMDIDKNIRPQLDFMDQINIVSGINKLTLAFSHLGTAIKKNSNFAPGLIIKTHLEENIENILSSELKEIFPEVLEVLFEAPELVQVDNYMEAIDAKLREHGWKDGEKFNAKKKELPSISENTLNESCRNYLISYIRFRNSLKYPYAMVINSAKDVSTYIDSAEFNKSIEKDRYKDEKGNPVLSYESLNNFQRIDWLRRKVELIMNDIEKVELIDIDPETNMVFASMQLHDARVIFGHLLPKLK